MRGVIPSPLRGGGLGRGARARFALWLALFDEQHGDAVDDRIEDLAVRAPEVVRLFELQLGVAPRAGQNLEQLLRDHACIVLRGAAGDN